MQEVCQQVSRLDMRVGHGRYARNAREYGMDFAWDIYVSN